MMSSNGADKDVKRIVADAVEDARDGPLDPERLQSVRQLLLTSPDARRYYLQFNELNHLLKSESFLPAPADVNSLAWEMSKDYLAHSGGLPDASESDVNVWRLSAVRDSKPILRSRFSTPSILLGTAAALVALVFAVFWHTSGQSRNVPRVIALLQDINGDVSVTSVDAEVRSVQSNVEIKSGDTIRIHGSLSSALLSYPDGTRLQLVRDTSLTCSDDGQKGVVLHGGTLFASVAPQPNAAPMLVVTPQDKVQVLGTRFSLEATADATDISVNEGRVKLTRLRDGKSVEVPAGQRVVSSAESELALQEIPAAPVEWSEDFESGLPTNWETGKFVTDDLPVGSKGAVQAVRLPHEGGAVFNINAYSNWPYGLFATHEDSHLHFTFKMDQPGWIDIIICTRTVDGNPPAFSSNYIFNERGWWPDEPGTWSTVSIPLAKFRRAASDRVPIDRVVPFSLVFSSPEGDRGLVIDRMWLTRDGSGTTD